MFRSICFSLLLITASAAQPESAVLESGKPIEKALAGGQSHSYRVAVSTGQCLRVTVDQRGIDVAVKIFGPDGKELVVGDLSDKGDVDCVVWIAEASGDYRIDIVAAKTAARGNYQVGLADLRAPNNQDRQRADAQQAFVDAEKLYAENKPDSRRKAIEKYDQAMRLWRGLGERSYEALTLYNIGDTHRVLGDYPKALDYLNQALEIRRATGRRKEEAQVLTAIGSTYSASGQKEKAVESYLQSLPIRRELDDRDGEALTLSNLGNAYFDLGEKRKARESFEQSLALRRDQRGKMITMANLGRVYRDLGEKRKAIKTQQEVLSLRRTLKDRNGEAVTLTDLGLIYSDIGEHQKALDSFAQASAIQRAPNTINFIGRTYYMLGAPQEALRYYDQALALMRNAKNQQGEADTLNYQALAFWAAEDYPKALAALDQALPIAREIKARLVEVAILNNYGRIYASMGDTRKALEYYSQALPLARAVSNRNGEAAMLNNIGFAHEALGDNARALDFHQQALKLSRDVGDRQREANVRYGIARIESSRNRLRQSRNQIEQTIRIVESLRSKLASPDLRAEYRASLQRYYDLHIDVLMRLHRRQPKSGFSAKALQVSEHARARSLIELLTEAGADIRQGVDQTLVEREREMQEQINDKTAEQIQSLGDKKKAEQVAALTQEIEQLSAELRNVQAQIRQSSPRYAAITQPQPLTVREIQQKLLDASTVLLEYSLGEERSYLWAVTRDSLRSFTLPRREEIESKARRLYELITARNQFRPNESNQKKQTRIANADAESREVAVELSRILLGRAVMQLGNRRLIIVADGALQYVPFAALPKFGSAASQPLIVHNEVVSLPSASTLAVLRREMAGRPAASKTIAVLADPVFEAEDERVKTVAVSAGKKDDKKTEAATTDPSRILLVKSATDTGAADAEFRIPRLPNTRREAETIMSLASSGSSKSAFDFSANRAAATSDELQPYRIVHFATHGFLNSLNPELSGLVLSLVDEKGAPQNGLLLAPEVYNLKLPSTDLVVLSACQTGLGKEIRGEGVVGLTRGFMYAGAPRVVVSLWNVSDRATADLMKSFYQGMLSRRMRPAAALRAAQIELWKQKQWQAPYYWAAFGLQGEWR